jgi:hypothetical protein
MIRQWQLPMMAGREDLGGVQHRAVGGALLEARLLDQLAPGVQQQDAHLV